MSRYVQQILASVAAVACAVALAACGGGGDAPAPPGTVVKVGDASITKASIDHWMSTIAGGDFYEISEITAPAGLVSEPPDYATCVAKLKSLVPSLSQQELRSRCEELYRAVRQQAISYLITVSVLDGQDAELGISASSGEVEHAFKQIQAEQYPKEAELQRHLAERHWSLSDELFVVKRDVLSSKLRSTLEHRFGRADGQQALVSFVHTMNKKWVAKTSCSAGYVVEGCRQYVSTQDEAANGPSAAVLIEGIADVRKATAKTAPGSNSKTAPDINCHNQGKKIICRPVKTG